MENLKKIAVETSISYFALCVRNFQKIILTLYWRNVSNVLSEVSRVYRIFFKCFLLISFLDSMF